MIKDTLKFAGNLLVGCAVVACIFAAGFGVSVLLGIGLLKNMTFMDYVAYSILGLLVSLLALVVLYYAYEAGRLILSVLKNERP